MFHLTNKNRPKRQEIQYYNPQASTPPMPQLQTFGAMPVTSHTIALVFRLSRPRTWAFPAVSFLLGYVLTVGWSLGQLGLGLLIASFVTASTNIVNAYADRKEDVVNQPRRVFWLDQMGHKAAIASVIIFYGLSIALSIYLGLAYMLVLGLGIFNSLFYSLPPLRFKAHPIRSLISFSGAVGLAFLAGTSVSGQVNLMNPMLWLVTYFMFTYGTVKNLPDYWGDRKAGTKTTATVFGDINRAVSFTTALLVSPYVLLVGLTLSGMLPVNFYLDLALIPLLLFIIYSMRKSKSSEGLERMHTFGFFYAISFLLFTLVVAAPSLNSLVAIVSTFLWTMMVSRIHIDSRIEKRDWENRPRQPVAVPQRKQLKGGVS